MIFHFIITLYNLELSGNDLTSIGMSTSTTKRLLRKFQINDFELATKADVMYVHFIELHPTFVAFDATFGGTYPATWKALIDECLTLTDDLGRVRSQQVLTIEMRKARQRCIDAFVDLRFFVRKAFNNSPAIVEAFRLREFHTKRYSKLDLLELLMVAYDFADTYSVELAAHGYTSAKHNELGNAIEAFNKAMVTLDMNKRERKSHTYHRIELHNQLWDELRRIHKAANIIFGAANAKAKLFALPWPKRKKKAEQETPPTTQTKE